MSFGVRDICEDTKMAREYALLGNYETALVYYQGAVQQIHRLLTTITDSIRKERWQQVFYYFIVSIWHMFVIFNFKSLHVFTSFILFV